MSERTADEIRLQAQRMVDTLLLAELIAAVANLHPNPGAFVQDLKCALREKIERSHREDDGSAPVAAGAQAELERLFRSFDPA